MHIQIPTLVLRMGLILTLGVSMAHAQQGAPQSTSLTAKTSATPAQAPEVFQVQFKTTQGDFVVQVHRKWSPRGADRVFELVRSGYFTDVAFFRVIKGYKVQFGIHGDPKVNRDWSARNIQDDPVLESNRRGYVTFAKTGRPHSRTTQLFINYNDNVQLDRMGFAPFGRVIQGMDVVDAINGEYGEGAPRGRGPSQGRMRSEGNDYLRQSFPKLDYIRSAHVMKTKHDTAPSK